MKHNREARQISSPPNRRNFLMKAVMALVAGVFGKRLLGAEPKPSVLTTEGEVLKASVSKGKPPIEPLDTMIRFERSDDNNGRAMTHEILSLMHEEKGDRSYPWTIYAHLDTHHVEGDACVLCSRLHKRDRGWSTGLHSEVFSSAPMVGLGVNVEMSNEYPGPEKTQLIGVNVQAHGPHDCQYGMQVHDADGHFEKGVGLNGKGQVGLDVAGEYGTGIHLHHNSLRMEEGASIELDGAGKVRIRCREGRIEFLNGDTCVAHISLHKADHEL